MGMINFLLMLVLAIVVFRVPLKGSFLALTIGAFLYVVTSTGLGLFLSTFMRSQIAAVFGVAIATMIPAIQFSGLIHPVSSLEGRRPGSASSIRPRISWWSAAAPFPNRWACPISGPTTCRLPLPSWC